MGETDRVFTADDRIVDFYSYFSHHFQAYPTAKARALNATDRLLTTETPHFEISNIIPSFFIGKNEFITNA